MNKGIVIAFGRFNPPTTGHALLLNLIHAEAAKRKADVMIFPSQSQDPKKNPLPFLEKVDFLETLFPGSNFSDETRVKTPVDALLLCSMVGYERAWVVVGSDRVSDFMKLSHYIKPHGVAGKDIILKEYGVIPVPGNRDPDAEGATGMSASKMRAAAAANDFNMFRQGVPGNRLDVAQRLFNSVRRHMKITESTQRQRAFLLYGPVVSGLAEAVREHTTMQTVTPRDVLFDTAAYQRLLSSKLPFAVDARNESYLTIKRVHLKLESTGIVPTVYIHQRRQRLVSEDILGHMTTSGMLRIGLARDVVEVATPGTMIRSMMNLLEADQAPKLKVPTEVDRLKANQKQQEIMMKTRQAQELLAAKQRELGRKTRDDMNKIKTGNQPAGAK